jgi:molybdopterin synthase sulfur carrier subunit
MTRVLFFGRVRDAAGQGEIAVGMPSHVHTVSDLRAWLAERDDVLAPVILSPSIRVAVDRVYCGDDGCLIGAEEIAFMSPLSGG